MMTTGKIFGHISSILYVEDSLTQSQRLKSCLEEEVGLHVHVVQTGEDGLKMVRNKQFDLIILDVELPGINGFEVCRRLKADATTADIPVIMLTVRDRVDDALKGMMSGVIDYIPKDPFAERVLIGTIKKINLR